MDTERKRIEEFELYLEGALDSEDRQLFEGRLATDPVFAREFAEYSILRKSFSAYGRRARMKAELEAIHRESGEIVNLKRKSPLVVLFKRHSSTIAVAASVSIITVLSVSLLYYYLVIQNPKTNFRELRRDMEMIKRDQQNLIKDIKNKDEVPKAYNPGRYGGTGVAISSNGYVVTSYHLVREARQIIVENSLGSFLAKEVYSDPIHDISILLIVDSMFSSTPAIPFSIKSKCSELGERVFTLGYPREDIVYGEGSISSMSGYNGDTASYQVSIPVNPGNSGGPVFDGNANLIGIISGKEINREGAAFAIKTSFILEALRSIPPDSLLRPLKLSKTAPGRVPGRVKQLQKLKDFVMVVKAT
jgi:serine protease Do